jgi:L-threonylcarbamoyladenylate synthase
VSAVPLVAPRDEDAVRRALGAGQVIAVPAAGGYALAALPDHPGAVAQFDHLTAALTRQGAQLMVGHRAQAEALTAQWTPEARHLIERCWPGPLTVVLATTGGSSVRVAMATERHLRRLCRESGPWLMAPVPATDPAHVQAIFDGAGVALVVDGGPCTGPGPTVVDCSSNPVRIETEGALPAAFVEAALLMAARRRRWRRPHA